MGEDVAEDKDGLIIEETMLGAGTEVTAVALKGLEHGVIAEAKVAVEAVAAVVAGAEVGVGAGAEAVAGAEAEASLVAAVEVIVAAQDIAAAAAAAVTVVVAQATTDIGVLGNCSLIKRILCQQ